MLRIRLSSLGDNKGDFEKDIADGENLKVLVEAVLVPLKLTHPIEDVFHVLLNGEITDPKDWNEITLRDSDKILIAPKLNSGEGGALLKQIVVITVALVVSSLPGGQTIGGAILTATATIGTAALLNTLFPPDAPTFAEGGLNSEDSQNYISGQSNQVARYRNVPKVYGTFKIFPNVAANPYIKLEVDPSGKLIQYLYAIYDFGFGPAYLSDIKIGDTPITEFQDVQYSLVDFNKPTTDEGPWDRPLVNKLTWYKGDFEADSVAVSLNGNQTVAGTPVAEYEAIRNTSLNSQNSKAEITLDFLCPAGLYGYNSNGALGTRNILLEIHFRKVGTTTWYGYDDGSVVDYYYFAGGDSLFSDSVCTVPPATDLLNPYTFLRQVFEWGRSGSWNIILYDSYGFKKGDNWVIIKTTSEAVGGRPVEIRGKIVGKLTGVSIPSTVTGYTKYFIDTPLQEDFEFVKAAVGFPYSAPESDAGVKIKIPETNKARLTRAETGPVYSQITFVPKELGQFEVRVRRLQTFGAFTSSVGDDLSWIGISARYDRAPIVTTQRHLFLEVKIKATNQLNGAIQNLNGVVSSILETYDGTTWTKEQTSNPAWIFVDLLTGPINKRAIDKSRLHLPSLLEWAEYCDEVPASPPGFTFEAPRFMADFIFDYEATLQQALNQISSMANASLNIIDGKYGVLIDKLKTTPVQVFTSRNSWGFNSTRNYSDKPHAVAVKFVSPELDYEVTETIVYDDGYNETNATKIDELMAFACRNQEQAWRYGRFMLAQNRLRQESISINVDFEHLVCTRGDYVRVAYDVMKAGGTPARVKTVVGNVITIDDSIESIGGSYGYMYRSSSTGTIQTDSLTILSASTFQLAGSIPAVGDLIIIGPTGSVYIDCLVKSITPNDDLSAELVLIEKADGVYTAESSGTIDPYDPQINPVYSTEFLPPGPITNLVVLENDWTVVGKDYEYYVIIDWDVPAGTAYEYFEIYVDSGLGFNIEGQTKETVFRYVVDHARLDIQHEFKVLAVSSSGKKLSLVAVPSVFATPLTKTTRPANVDSLNIDITGEVLQLLWPQVQEPDIREYLIRYSPNVNGTWEASIPLLRISAEGTLAATQARTGIYLIKAVDLNYNESAVATAAITTIPNLFGLNVIDEITDFPLLEGSKTRVDSSTGKLMIQKSVIGDINTTEYYSDGYYYYQNLLDLGEIYTVRLQSLIEAEGFTLGDLMSEWTSLADLTAMSQAGFSDWDVETQYRATNSYNVIADWSSMSSVSQLSFGEDDDWTQWKKFTIGDATGRIFQFRLKLISNKLNVTPRVFEGLIKADMPDRIERYNNILALSTGKTITYSPAFAGPDTSPSIQITIDDALSGDYYVFGSKTLTGFTITFYDKNDVAVSRTFDAQVLGYGRRAATTI